MQLVNELIKGLLPEEETKKTIGVFAGGFKPPTKGHFEVLKQALEENPEIDEMLVFVGKKERDGITQDESLKVWEIYGKYLPFKVKFVKATTSPIRLIYNTAKDNPEDEVVWVIGAREGNEEDFKDLASRTKGMSKYPNLELRTVITTGGTSTTSGTAARNALQVSKEKFDRFVPDFLSDQEKQDIYVMLTNKIQEKKDPKTGTGKKPKGSSRRLYTDEDPKDTVSVKFSTRQDIVDTLNKKSFKAKSHARQSQIINLIHQRVRAAYGRAKDPAVKKRLKTALDYAEQRKEASKKKTQRLRNQKNENIAPNHDGKAAPFGSGYKEVKEGDTIEKYSAKGKATGKLKQGTVRKRLNIPKGKKIPLSLINKEISRLKKMDKDPDKKGAQLGDKNQKYYKALQLAKTLKTTTNVNENASYTQNIDIKKEIADLTKHMIKIGLNIQPLPKLMFKHGDSENAREFLGKTAYYDPNTQTIVLYTEGRHPKDIVRSYSHEMVHHIQNLEDRLGNIQGTNTMEDDHLNQIEQEANLIGTMTFRNWTDSLNENVKVDQVDQLEFLLNKWTAYSGQYDLLPEIARLAKNLGVNNGPSVVYRAVPGLDEYPYTKQEIIDYDKEQEIVSTSAAKEQAEEFITSEADWAYILEYKPHIIVNFDEFEKKYSWTGNWGEGEILIDVSKSKLIKIKSYTLNEATNKDPFGINAYAMELARLREEETEYQIYCDMDGVLADFERGYEELTGIDLKNDPNLEGKEFWDPVTKAGVKFWAGLKWMPDGKELWDYIKPHTPKLLSAPTREESSRIGKYVWVKHKIPGTKLILRYASKKKELATPTSILIDDRKSNIDSWEAAGGIGILHTSTASTIEKLKELGL